MKEQNSRKFLKKHQVGVLEAVFHLNLYYIYMYMFKDVLQNLSLVNLEEKLQ